MGKTSNKFIDDVNVRLGKIGQEADAFETLKPVWTSFCDSQIHLIDQRVDILNGTYRGDEKQALRDPRYIALGTQAEAQEARGRQIEARMEQHLKDIDTQVASGLFILNQFEKFVDEKDKTTKMPWNKKSIGSSRKYIEETRDKIKSYKKPNFRPAAEAALR